MTELECREWIVHSSKEKYNVSPNPTLKPGSKSKLQEWSGSPYRKYKVLRPRGEDGNDAWKDLLRLHLRKTRRVGSRMLPWPLPGPESSLLLSYENTSVLISCHGPGMLPMPGNTDRNNTDKILFLWNVHSRRKDIMISNIKK